MGCFRLIRLPLAARLLGELRHPVQYSVQSLATSLVLTAAMLALLAGCGTASGLAEGTGRVFEGVGEDFRSLSDQTLVLVQHSFNIIATAAQAQAQL